jgi:hypothetical protein
MNASYRIHRKRGKRKTVVGTESGVAELKSGANVTHIAARRVGAGTPQGGAKPADDEEHGLHLWAPSRCFATGAVAAIIYATTHNNDINFGGTVNVVSPTK